MRANCGKPKNKSVKLMEVIVEKKRIFILLVNSSPVTLYHVVV